MALEQRKSKAPPAPLARSGHRSRGRTISNERLIEIEKELHNLKVAARSESNPSELRFRVLMGARTIRQLVDRG
jgi:hypothetical protein